MLANFVLLFSSCSTSGGIFAHAR